MQNPFVQLAEIRRGPAVESIHHGIAVVMDSEGHQVLAMGDPAFVTFPRSSLKPYQAVALVETLILLIKVLVVEAAEAVLFTQQVLL